MASTAAQSASLLKQSLAEKKEWEEERRRMVQESVEQVRARVDAENAARHAASSSTGKRRKRKKRRKKRLPRGRARRRQRQRPLSGALIVDSGRGMCRAGFPSSCCVPFGCRQAQMLGIMAGMDQKDFAVHVVRELGGAPGPVHRQSGGHSCFMSMDLADPVSSGKYSGIFVLTAPVAEPTVVSFTVPLNGCSIVATATVVTSCSSSTDCPGSAGSAGVFASRCRVVVDFSLLMVLTILFGTV